VISRTRELQAKSSCHAPTQHLLRSEAIPGSIQIRGIPYLLFRKRSPTAPPNTLSSNQRVDPVGWHPIEYGIALVSPAIETVTVVKTVKLIVSLFLGTLAWSHAAVPDLAQLKVAAERGDAVAQFEYSLKIAISNSNESFAMALKSAQQGYGPAEDKVGSHYARIAAFAGKDKPSIERLAVRYTSRAAFKGIPAALERLSSFYARGIAVPKEPFMAYGFLAVALREAGGPKELRAIAYKLNLDQLISKVSTDDIARGEQFARQFRVGSDNFVEVDLLVKQMRLNAVVERDGKKMVIVNQTRFGEGETKALNIDGEMVDVRCIKIEGKTAELAVMNYRFRLATK